MSAEYRTKTKSVDCVFFLMCVLKATKLTVGAPAYHNYFIYVLPTVTKKSKNLIQRQKLTKKAMLS